MAKSELNSPGVPREMSRLRGVPVFLFHGIARAHQAAPAGERKYWIPEEQFRGYLEIIRSEAFTPATLASFWSSARPAGDFGRCAVITFDDGHASDYQAAFPLLQEFGCRADFFVNPANIDRPGFLSWSQMAEMQRAGMSFQSHGWDHVNLSALPAPETERQLGNSRRELQNRLGAPVEFLSVPYGLFNRGLIETALELGYRAVCCSRSFPARAGRTPINRVAIHSSTSRAQFARLLNGHPGSYAARLARAGLLYLPKQLILSLRPERLTVRKSGAQA